MYTIIEVTQEMRKSTLETETTYTKNQGGLNQRSM